MAQDYAPLYRSIWSDDDYRSLSVDAQWLFTALMSQPGRNAAGVLSLTVRKWSRLSADMTSDRVEAALEELDAASFIVVDHETEEVLVRSHIRRAKVYTHIRLFVNALRDASEVESERLRSALGQELVRLPKLAVPTGSERMADEARQAQHRLDELVSIMCDSPPDPPGDKAWTDGESDRGQHPGHAMPHPMADGIAHPHGVGAGTGAGVGTGAVRGSSSLKEDLVLEVDARTRPALTGLCREHPGQPARSCSGCRSNQIGAA